MHIEPYDLHTFCKVITTNPTSLGLGAVPTGTTRYITFLRAENGFAGDNKLYIVSVATETYASTIARASTVKKDFYLLANGDTRIILIPELGPSPYYRPLFSIAADAYLNGITDKGAVTIFGQYYER